MKRPRPVIAPAAGGALRPAEITNAGVFASLAVVIISVGALLPHLGAIQLLAVVPFGIVGLRHRARAVIAAAVAAAFVGFLVAGVTSSAAAVACAVLGGLCGIIRRHGRGGGTVTVVAAGLAPLVAAVMVGLLALFSQARVLAFGSVRATIAGLVRIAGSLHLPAAAGHAVIAGTDALLTAWPVVVTVVCVVGVPAAMLLTNALVVLVARRIEWLADSDPLGAAAQADTALDKPVAPVPLKLVHAGFRHQDGSGRHALTDIDLTVEPGEFVAIVGPNGAGKSTLVSVLAGAQPTSGWVKRPGRVGLGLPGGTAIVSQRAETQAIGSTVEEDLRWGLPAGYPLDVEAVLELVRLDGLATASTESLSGGQLQRLAVATAIARHPALLISDESTAMLDAAGRADVLSILAGLPARTGTTVVHVTHDIAEAARADRVVGLADGRITDMPHMRYSGPVTRGAGAGIAERGPLILPADVAVAQRGGARKPVITLSGVGHRFDPGTPWEVTALRSVDLQVREGEGLLITGENGSGKSTLAWVLAGLIRPTEGTATVDGTSSADAVGTVALSFQHARLQLQRPTVAEDILAAAGFSARSDGTDPGSLVRMSLHRVGLPAELAGRTIDALSGGQMRRVAIAGLLASRPRMLVLDEPLAGLDRDSRRGLLELLGRMRREEGLTLVVISHDLEDMSLACDRMVQVTDGILAQEGGCAPPPAAQRTSRSRRAGLVLRPLPGTSPLHRLGAGVKLLALAAVTIASLLLPGWPTVALLGALFLGGAFAVKLPPAVFPRVSPWFAAVVALGGVVSAAGSGFGVYARSLLIGLLFFALSLLVIWTTPVEELPGAFARTAGPLRKVGVPVDEWAHTVALAVRTLPLLRDEIRTLIAVRRLRPAPSGATRTARIINRTRALTDLVTSIVASAGRRASDLGRAATQRGGMQAAKRYELVRVDQPVADQGARPRPTCASDATAAVPSDWPGCENATPVEGPGSLLQAWFAQQAR